MSETYTVTIVNPRNFPAEQRTRAGIVVSRESGYEGPLTEVQVKAIEADEHLVLEKPAAPKSEKKTAKK